MNLLYKLAVFAQPLMYSYILLSVVSTNPKQEIQPVKDSPRNIYTTNFFDNSSTVIDTRTNRVVGTIELGDRPYGTAVNNTSSRIFIGHYGENTISVIDPATSKVEHTIQGAGRIVTGIAVSPDGKRLYTCSYGANTVRVYDAMSYKFIVSVRVGNNDYVSAPLGIIVSPDNSRVYISIFDEQQVAVIDAKENKVTGYYKTDDRPSGMDISNDGSKLYVANQNTNTLVIYNTAGGERLVTIPLGTNSPGKAGPAGVTLNHANTLAYVAVQDENAVKVVDISTNKVLKSIAVGERPFGVDILPDDSRLYVSCIEGNRVDVINTTDHKKILSIDVGEGPYSYGKFIMNMNIPAPKDAAGNPVKPGNQ